MTILHQYDFSNVGETREIIRANFYIIRDNFDHLHIKMQIGDINVITRFVCLYPSLYRGTKGCILCFNIANRNSSNRLPNLIKFIRLNAGTIPIILVGTKVDLNHQVSGKNISDLVRNFNLCGTYLTSINMPFKRDIIFEHLSESYSFRLI